MDDAINFLLDEARWRILKIARPDSCILSTRIAIEFLRKLQLPAKALAVKCVVMNPVIVQRSEAYVEEHNDLPPWPVLRGWQFDGSGGWILGVGYGDPRPGCYAGHLVALCGSTMLDLSLDQANRPLKQIELGPVAIDNLTPDFMRGDQAVTYPTSSGCMLRYELHDDPAWQRSGDWNERWRWRPTVDELLARFKQEKGAPCGQSVR